MNRFFVIFVSLTLLITACTPQALVKTGDALQVIAIESFLGDIAQQVAGDRLSIQTLIPAGTDPHAFEPSPQDIVKLTNSKAIIINGAGFEAWLDSSYQSNLQQQLIIDASKGLTIREQNEAEHADGEEQSAGETGHLHEEGDPHFWLDPTNVIRYVENIRDGLAQIDPAGKEQYSRNAAAYIEQLKELDVWIQSEVSAIPPEKRIMITNHESFGYFADRYGFRIIGTIIPSVTTGSSPSSQQLTDLITKMRENDAHVIFLETGSNPQLANQIASETGARVVEDLYIHSITAPDGNAPSYLDMMRWNTRLIVEALK